jgi:hypothetical protein
MRPAWRILHVAIIGILVLQAVYSFVQLLVFLQPEGVVGPLFGTARDIDHDLLMARRAYAIEGWIALVGLFLYLAVTEIGPRRRRDLDGPP